MKVKELIDILSKVDGEMGIIGTWEGQYKEIDTIYIEDNTVLLDVGDGFYIRHEVERYPESMEKVLYMGQEE